MKKLVLVALLLVGSVAQATCGGSNPMFCKVEDAKPVKLATCGGSNPLHC